MDRRHDPRTIVTPYAFSVHPDLLGMPLATPWQRLGAIAVDGVVIMGLYRIGGFTLAVATSLLLFWLAIRGPGRNAIGKFFRMAAGCMGLLVASITAIVFFSMQALDNVDLERETRTALEEMVDSLGLDLNVPDSTGDEDVDLSAFISVVPDIWRLQQVEDSEEAEELMVEVAQTARAGGVPLSDIRLALESFIPEDVPWADEGDDLVRTAMASLRTDLGEETPEGQETRETITDPVALDSIRSLNALVRDLDEERDDAEAELRRARTALEEEEGLITRLMNFLDELGLGFGWGALYLTITHALWKGTSVGKKLFRIRVVMIDLRPLNWWLSFERVGGYAAGLATGLLGFVQIFWDPNRQAIHDKVSETIVIQTGKEPVQGPWMMEGKAQWERNRTLDTSLPD